MRSFISFKYKISVMALVSLIIFLLFPFTLFFSYQEKSVDLDQNIGQLLGLYDKNGNSKIVQQYHILKNNDIKFLVGTNINKSYNPHNNWDDNFSNIDFASLTDSEFHPLPGTEKFLKESLKLNVVNHKIVSEVNPFYWKKYDGKNHPTFNIKVINFYPNIEKVKEQFQYFDSQRGYEKWTIRMPETSALIAFVNKSNDEEKILSYANVKIAGNDLYTEDQANLFILKSDITYTSQFNSVKKLNAKNFNDSIKFQTELSNYCLITNALATVIHCPIIFRICTWDVNNDMIWILPNQNNCWLDNLHCYVIACFIGNVLIDYKSLVLNYRP